MVLLALLRVGRDSSWQNRRFPLTALTEAQRAQALGRFTIIRPALEDGVSKAQVARTSKQAPSTIQLWMKRYQEKGLAGLANNVARSDKGKSSQARRHRHPVD